MRNSYTFFGAFVGSINKNIIESITAKRCKTTASLYQNPLIHMTKLTFIIIIAFCKMGVYYYFTSAVYLQDNLVC